MTLKGYVTRHPRLAKAALKLWAKYDWTLPTEPDFKVFNRLNLPNGIFLDVGAHVGESARSFRKFNHQTPVVSVEANPASFAELKRLEGKLDAFSVMNVMASDQYERKTLFIPNIDHIPFPSLGGDNPDRIRERLVRNWDIVEPSRITFDLTHLDAKPLDHYDFNPCVIKVDVEGHERSVLRGLVHTIERHRPIILLEIEMEDIWLIACDLIPGYECLVYDDKQKSFRAFKPGDPHVTQNAWFVPMHELSQFQSINADVVRRCGLV